MYATSCAIALALLNGQPGTPLPHVSPEEWPAVRAAIIGIAVEWEILDEREERFVHWEDLSADLEAMRHRRRELRKAPPLCDARRFPSQCVIEERLAFNRAYRRQLERNRAMVSRGCDELDAAIRETDQLYRIWDTLRDLRSDAYYTPVRRLAMQRLRDQLGVAAYDCGRLPPHVPLWRFVEVK